MDPNWGREDGHGPLWVCNYFKQQVVKSYLLRYGAHEDEDVTTQKFEEQQEKIAMAGFDDLGDAPELGDDDSDEAFRDLSDDEEGGQGGLMLGGLIGRIGVGDEAGNMLLPAGVHPEWQTHPDRNVWTEHLDMGSGRFYYRNKIRNITLWDKEALDNGIIKALKDPPASWIAAYKAKVAAAN